MNVFKRAWFWVKNDRKCLDEYWNYLICSTLLHVAYFMVLSLSLLSASIASLLVLLELGKPHANIAWRQRPVHIVLIHC